MNGDSNKDGWLLPPPIALQPIQSPWASTLKVNLLTIYQDDVQWITFNIFITMIKLFVHLLSSCAQLFILYLLYIVTLNS